MTHPRRLPQLPQLRMTDSTRCIITVDVDVVDTKAKAEAVMVEGEGAARVVNSADGVVVVAVETASAVVLEVVEASADEVIRRSSKPRQQIPLLFSAHSCTIGIGVLEVGSTNSLVASFAV